MSWFTLANAKRPWHMCHLPTFSSTSQHRIGPHRVELVPLWQLWVELNSHSILLRLWPRVESPQPGIKPFPTLLTAHFRAVSYKPVAAICIKVGSFVHEEEYRRNMKSLFPVLTAQTFRRACLTSWKFVLFEHRPPINIMTDRSELIINKQRFFIGKYRWKYLQKQQHSHINTLTS